MLWALRFRGLSQRAVSEGVAGLTIKNVFEMFEIFGIPASQVNQTLDECEDKLQAFNAFEGLKIQATIRYEEMQSGEVSAAQLQEAGETHERLMKISLKNYTPKKKKAPRRDIKDLYNTNTYRRLGDIIHAVQTKNADELMRFLGVDPKDPRERRAAEFMILRFEKFTKGK